MKVAGRISIAALRLCLPEIRLIRIQDIATPPMNRAAEIKPAP